jgi:roadblock/LC7 domain-containing protein
MYVNKKAKTLVETQGSHAAVAFLDDSKDGKLVTAAKDMYHRISKLKAKDILMLQKAATEEDKKAKEYLTILRRSLTDLFEQIEGEEEEEDTALAAL